MVIVRSFSLQLCYSCKYLILLAFSYFILGHAIGSLTLDVHIHATTSCEDWVLTEITLELMSEVMSTMGARDWTQWILCGFSMHLKSPSP